MVFMAKLAVVLSHWQFCVFPLTSKVAVVLSKHACVGDQVGAAVGVFVGFGVVGVMVMLGAAVGTGWDVGRGVGGIVAKGKRCPALLPLRVTFRDFDPSAAARMIISMTKMKPPKKKAERM